MSSATSDHDASTHAAIVTVTPAGPLEIHQVRTAVVGPTEVKLLNRYACSTPLDLHMHAGHLLVKPPHVLGSGFAGTVLEVGSAVVSDLQPGDRVFGYTPGKGSHQAIVVADEKLMGKVPESVTMQAAVTVPNNFITVLHLLTADFGMQLPWPKPPGYVPKDADAPVLIWGGSSSVGMYAVQVLRWLGYRNLVVVAGKKHWERLRNYGASTFFDYRDGDVVEQVHAWGSKQGDGKIEKVRYFLDCIGSLEGSVKPITKIAKEGSTVAVLLPVIVRDAAEGVKPEYSLDVHQGVQWQQGVEAKGVRTHFYLKNPLLAEKGQSEIMPTMLETGIIEPNEQVVVEGDTLLMRAENAMKMLRDKVASGQRLVWKVEEGPQD